MSLPTFAFLGDPAADLARSIAGSVQLMPYQGDLGAAAGLLVDATTAEVNLAIATGVLAAGKALAVARPSAADRDALRSLAGHAPAEAVPLVSYRATGFGGFTSRLLPEGAHGDGHQAPPDLRAELSRLAGAPVAGTGVWSMAGFLPPAPQVQAGYASYVTVFSWSAPVPSNPQTGTPDDITVRSPTEIVSEVLTEFFVYWVNGTTAAPTATPYYMVVVRETGPLAIGAFPPGSTPASRGYFQLAFTDGPATITLTQGGTTVTLAGYTPTTQAAGQLSLGLSLPMAVCSLLSPGNSLVFTATNQPASPLDFEGWGVLDQTAGAAVKWSFHQVQVWDPTQVPPGDPSLLTTLFDAAGAVVAVPSLSLGSLPFQVMSAWQVGPPVTGSSTVPVTYQTTYQQLVGLAHAPAGCLGAFGQPLRHTFTAASTQPGGPWVVDLEKVASQMNYPATSTPPS